jgi:hypothetical protein
VAPAPKRIPRTVLFVGGFQAQRQLLDDFDLAFGRQAQRGGMFARDVISIRHNSFVA